MLVSQDRERALGAAEIGAPSAKKHLAEIWNAEDETWQHLRTTNPIASTFATGRHRTKVTKGRSRAAGLAMAFKTH